MPMRISGYLNHSSGPVEHALVHLNRREAGDETNPQTTLTREAGRFEFRVERSGNYVLRGQAFGKSCERIVEIADDSFIDGLTLELHLEIHLSVHAYSGHDERLVPVEHAIVGRRCVIRIETAVDSRVESYRWEEHHDAKLTQLGKEAELLFAVPGRPRIEITIVDKEAGELEGEKAQAQAKAWIEIPVSRPDEQRIGGHVRVTMERTPSDPTLDQALWVAIRERTHAISFDRYQEFMRRVLEFDDRNDNLPEFVAQRLRDRGIDLHGVNAFQVLKYMTEAFLLTECGVRIDIHRRRNEFDAEEETQRLGERYSPEQMERKLREYLGPSQQLPYIRRVIDAAFPEFEREGGGGHRLLTAQVGAPLLIELINTYWLEEGMVVQAFNALCQRFQNVHSARDYDPLGNLEIDPLTGASNILWGFILDQPNQTTVRWRASEYDHSYGLKLFGRAAFGLRPAESRSNFLGAFHNVLHLSIEFFKDDAQTTVIAEGWQLLNGLKQLHLVLAQGIGNQYRGLAWTARVETLLMRLILARREVRDFLQSRIMVPYKEPWMAQVDTMKALQGWTDVSVTAFHDLAVYGERLLLGARFGDWINVNDEDSAKNWARYHKREIYGYVNAYRAATGVDLTSELIGPDSIDATIPSVLLQRRLATQRISSQQPNLLGFAPAVGQVGQMQPRLPNPARRQNS